jgi:hypothetical protein
MLAAAAETQARQQENRAMLASLQPKVGADITVSVGLLVTMAADFPRLTTQSAIRPTQLPGVPTLQYRWLS